MITKTTGSRALLVTGAQLIDPTIAWNSPCDLLIEHGKVSALDKPGSLKTRAKSLNAEFIEASGLHMAPGFIDLNCSIHEPGAEHIESFSTGSKAAAAGGFTTLLLKPVSDPVHDNAFMTDFILRRARENSVVRITLMGALTAGLEGKKLAEIGSMAASGIRAVGDGAHLTDSYLMRKGLEYCKAFQIPVFAFPEDRYLAGQGVMNEGWNSNRLGLRGIPAAAEEIGVARDLVLLKHTKSAMHVQSLSTEGAISALRRGKDLGLQLSAETNPAYFSLNSDSISTYDANFKCHPPLRSQEDVDATIEGLADGTIDVVATAHTPRSKSSKEQAFELASSGMIGLESTFPLTLELVQKKKISPSRMVELLSSNPAKIIGLSDRIGTLRVGAWGDFVLFDPKERYEFNSDSVYSASRNSPFMGWKMQGAIKATYIAGSLVFVEEGKS